MPPASCNPGTSGAGTRHGAGRGLGEALRARPVLAAVEALAAACGDGGYDSPDRFGSHPREADYVALDAASPAFACDAAAPAPAPAPGSAAALAPARAAAAGGPGSGPGGTWRTCTEAREAGAAPVHRGDPGYGSHLDRDDDGIGCE